MAVAPRDGLPEIELAAKSGRNNSRSESCRTGRRPCPQSGPLWWPPNSEPTYPRSKLGQFEVCTRTLCQREFRSRSDQGTQSNLDQGLREQQRTATAETEHSTPDCESSDWVMPYRLRRPNQVF